jgi:glycosyltransferase involved in cell wall biosynthesis
MKILLISYYFPPKIIGGAELSSWYTAIGLRQLGHQVSVVIGREVDVGFVKFDAFQPKSFRYSSKWHYLSEFFLPRTVAREILGHFNLEDYDVVHAISDLFSFLVLAEMRRLLNFPRSKPRFVFTVRDYLTLCGFGDLLHKSGSNLCPQCSFKNRLTKCYSLRQKPVYLRWGSLLFPQVIRNRTKAFLQMDGVIYISNYVRDLFAERIRFKGHTAVIYNPFPKEWLGSSYSQKAPKALLYVGRIEKHKGIYLLLNVMLALKTSVSGVKLFCVGEGLEEGACRQIVREWGLQDSISFLGWKSQEELSELYSKTSICVIPSRWHEPFGRIVIEAMSKGCLVLASNQGAFLELIDENRNGFLFENNDLSSLRERVTYLLREEANLDGVRRQAVSFARQFTIERCAKDHIAFYNDLINATGK